MTKWVFLAYFGEGTGKTGKQEYYLLVLWHMLGCVMKNIGSFDDGDEKEASDVRKYGKSAEMNVEAGE